MSQVSAFANRECEGHNLLEGSAGGPLQLALATLLRSQEFHPPQTKQYPDSEALGGGPLLLVAG